MLFFFFSLGGISKRHWQLYWLLTWAWIHPWSGFGRMMELQPHSPEVKIKLREPLPHLGWAFLAKSSQCSSSFGHSNDPFFLNGKHWKYTGKQCKKNSLKFFQGNLCVWCTAWQHFCSAGLQLHARFPYQLHASAYHIILFHWPWACSIYISCQWLLSLP